MADRFVKPPFFQWGVRPVASRGLGEPGGPVPPVFIGRAVTSLVPEPSGDMWINFEIPGDYVGGGLTVTVNCYARTFGGSTVAVAIVLASAAQVGPNLASLGGFEDGDINTDGALVPPATGYAPSQTWVNYCVLNNDVNSGGLVNSPQRLVITEAPTDYAMPIAASNQSFGQFMNNLCFGVNNWNRNWGGGILMTAAEFNLPPCAGGAINPLFGQDNWQGNAGIVLPHVLALNANMYTGPPGGPFTIAAGSHAYVAGDVVSLFFRFGAVFTGGSGQVVCESINVDWGAGNADIPPTAWRTGWGEGNARTYGGLRYQTIDMVPVQGPAPVIAYGNMFWEDGTPTPPGSQRVIDTGEPRVTSNGDDRVTGS